MQNLILLVLSIPSYSSFLKHINYRLTDMIAMEIFVVMSSKFNVDKI
jgi:hypothetical protein